MVLWYVHTYVSHGSINEKNRKEGQYDIEMPDQGIWNLKMMFLVFYSVMKSGTFMTYDREQIICLNITFVNKSNKRNTLYP